MSVARTYKYHDDHCHDYHDDDRNEGYGVGFDDAVMGGGGGGSGGEGVDGGDKEGDIVMKTRNSRATMSTPIQHCLACRTTRNGTSVRGGGERGGIVIVDVAGNGSWIMTLAGGANKRG